MSNRNTIVKRETGKRIILRAGVGIPGVDRMAGGLTSEINDLNAAVVYPTGGFPANTIPLTGVTQYQDQLAIARSQITGLNLDNFLQRENVPSQFITANSVTQHEGALSIARNQITGLDLSGFMPLANVEPRFITQAAVTQHQAALRLDYNTQIENTPTITNGRDGHSAGLLYVWNTTTTANTTGISSLGHVAINDADPEDATRLHLSNYDETVHPDVAYLRSWGRSTSDIKGVAKITRVSDGDYVFYDVTSLTTNTRVTEFVINYLDGDWTPAMTNGQAVRIEFYSNGDRGMPGRDGTGTGTGTSFTGPRNYAFSTVALMNASTGHEDGDVAIVRDDGSGSPGHFFYENNAWHAGNTGDQGPPGASLGLPYVLNGNTSVPGTGSIKGQVFVNATDEADITTVWIANLDNQGTTGEDRRNYLRELFNSTSDTRGKIHLDNRHPTTGVLLGSFTMSVGAITSNTRRVQLTKATGTTNSSSGAGLGHGSTLAVFGIPRGDKGTTGNTPDVSGFLTSEVNDLRTNVTWPNSIPPSVVSSAAITQHVGDIVLPYSQISGRPDIPSIDGLLNTNALSSVSGAINTNTANGNITTSANGADIVAHRGNLGAGGTGLAKSETGGNLTITGYAKLGDFNATESAAVTDDASVWYSSANARFEGRANGEIVPLSGDSGGASFTTAVSTTPAGRGNLSLSGGVLTLTPAAYPAITDILGPLTERRLWGTGADGTFTQIDPTTIGSRVSYTRASASSSDTDANVTFDEDTQRITFRPAFNHQPINTETGITGQVNVVQQVDGRLQLTAFMEQFVGNATESPTNSVLTITNRGSSAADREYGYRPAPGVRKEIIQAFNSTGPTNNTNNRNFNLPTGRTLGDYAKINVKIIHSNVRSSRREILTNWLVIDVFDLINDTTSHGVGFDSVASGGPNGFSMVLTPSLYNASSTSINVSFLNVNDNSSSSEFAPSWNIQAVTGQLV